MPVLIIEDEESLADFFRAALASRGIECRCVSTSEAAHAAIAAQRPSLILTDMNLPGESGLEFVQHLKSDPHLADIPIVAITADDLHWNRQALLGAGCVDFLVKPVLLKHLIQVVQSHVKISS